MKGFMIYEAPLWGYEENVVYLQEVKDASYTLKQIGSDDITCYLEGTATKDPVTKATCNKEDTYDFETGALIALMKMCGRDKVIKACDELYKDDNYKNALQEVTESLDSLSKKYDLVVEGYDYWKEQCKKLDKENKKLQHEYDLCKNSENALKCSVDYLNKTIAKLNIAIAGYKEDLNKATKRCEELEIKESILNKQEETINKREEEMSVYFGGRGCGKQYKALVELFKKIDQKKVDAAYKEAYNTTLPVWQREFLKEALSIYKPPTKREEMWAEIFALHKVNDVVIKVKKEDVNAFLHEIENKIPEITWASTVKIFETKYTIKDIYDGLKSRDTVYFRLWKENILSYSSDEFIYAFKGFKHIDYLPPMRWDLFEKGRLVVKVDTDNYEDFYNKCEVEIGRKPLNACKGTFTVYYSKGTFHRKPYKDDIPFAKKIVNWEDVR